MNPRAILTEVDQRLGYPLTAVIENRRERRRFEAWERDRVERVRKHGIVPQPSPDIQSVVRSIATDGFAIVPRAVPPETVNRLKTELEQRLDSGTALLRVPKDSARLPGDRSAATVFLTEEETARGQQWFRDHTNFATVAEPLVNCPASVPLAFNNLLIDIASAYLECFPALGGANLRKSFANDLAEFDTLYFHVDPNSPKFLKFFFYLNDVDETGGPFCYVRGSLRRRFPGWTRKYRWSYEEIAPIYGPENIVNVTARAGDLIVADTNGFHRGTKVQSRDRAMLTVDYVVHQEFDGTQRPFQLRRADHESFSDRQRRAAEFCEIVE